MWKVTIMAQDVFFHAHYLGKLIFYVVLEG
jgi:hypothetical protein